MTGGEAIGYLSEKLGLTDYPNGTEQDLEKDDRAFGCLITLEEILKELEQTKKALDRVIDVGHFDDYVCFELFEEKNKGKTYNQIIKDKAFSEVSK